MNVSFIASSRPLSFDSRSKVVHSLLSAAKARVTVDGRSKFVSLHDVPGALSFIRLQSGLTLSE